jgi:hypothetical protein
LFILAWDQNYFNEPARYFKAIRRVTGGQLGEAKHIAHTVKSRRPVMQPDGRLQRPGRKQFAVGGMMTQFDGLGRRYERHGVIADDIPGPHRLNTDRAIRPLTGLTAATDHSHIRKANAANIGHRFTELQGRPGGRVDFVTVMRLDYFNIDLFP